MSCEDGGEIELPHARHDESDAAHPLVEVGDNPDGDWTDCWYTDATLTSMDCPGNNDQTPIVFGKITECSEGAEICESKFEEVANIN